PRPELAAGRAAGREALTRRGASRLGRSMPTRRTRSATSAGRFESAEPRSIGISASSRQKAGRKKRMSTLDQTDRIVRPKTSRTLMKNAAHDLTSMAKEVLILSLEEVIPLGLLRPGETRRDYAEAIVEMMLAAGDDEESKSKRRFATAL